MSLQRSFKYGKRAAYGMAIAAVVLTTMSGGMAAGRTPLEGCATRDAQIIMMLESSSVSARHMNHALHTIMHARVMCFDGHVMDALALYDDIEQSIAPGWMVASPPQ